MTERREATNRPATCDDLITAVERRTDVLAVTSRKEKYFGDRLLFSIRHSEAHNILDELRRLARDGVPEQTGGGT